MFAAFQRMTKKGGAMGGNNVQTASNEPAAASSEPASDEQAAVSPAVLPAPIAYTATRCSAFFGVWVVGNAVLIAPAGWTCVRVSAGRYEIVPNPADVRDVRQSIASACINWIDSDTPAARTLTVVTGPDRYIVAAADSLAAAADASFALMVLAG